MTTGPEADRFELLAVAGEVADGTQLLDDTVTRLLGLVVPAFADVATLDSIAPDGELRRLGSRVDAPRRREELEAALLRRRPLPDAPVGLPRAIVSAESQLLESVADDELRMIASSEEDFELLRALELRSALFVPLRARGRTVGALALGVGTSGRSYDEDDLRYAEILSGRLALALDNATLSQTVTGLERRLEATLTNLAEAVLVREAGGPIVFANSAAARLLSLGSAQDVTDATPEELMALYDVFDEAGRSLNLADLPVRARRARRGRRAVARPQRDPRHRRGALAAAQGHAGVRPRRLAVADRERDRGPHGRQARRARPASARRGRTGAVLLAGLRAHASARRGADGAGTGRLVCDHDAKRPTRPK